MAKVDLGAAIAKSLSRAPLSDVELDELSKVDTGALISEHDLTLSQATLVMDWCDHEALRIAAQAVTYGQVINDSGPSED